MALRKDGSGKRDVGFIDDHGGSYRYLCSLYCFVYMEIEMEAGV